MSNVNSVVGIFNTPTSAEGAAKAVPQSGLSAGRTPESTSASALAELPTSADPTDEQIALRAFSIFVQSGRMHGHCHYNWFLAKKCLEIENRAAPWARGWRREITTPQFEYSPLVHNEIMQSMPSMDAAGIR